MREKLIELLIQYDKHLLAYFERSNAREVGELIKDDIAKRVDFLIKNGATIPVRCEECFYHDTDKACYLLGTDDVRIYTKNGFFCAGGRRKEE